MHTVRIMAAVGIGATVLIVSSCGAQTEKGPESPEQHLQHRAPGPGSPNGYWDDNGQPVNGGPPGADGSTGNNLTQQYCAAHRDPACPLDSYAGSNAYQRPNYGKR